MSFVINHNYIISCLSYLILILYLHVYHHSLKLYLSLEVHHCLGRTCLCMPTEVSQTGVELSRRKSTFFGSEEAQTGSLEVALDFLGMCAASLSQISYK